MKGNSKKARSDAQMLVEKMRELSQTRRRLDQAIELVREGEKIAQEHQKLATILAVLLSSEGEVTITQADMLAHQGSALRLEVSPSADEFTIFYVPPAPVPEEDADA